MITLIIIGVIVALLIAVAIYDLTQRELPILRNFPIIGHLRYIIEAFGPELRQYIVTGNEDERPFNRNERRWIYATAEKENAYFGFGTDMNFDMATSHILIKPAAFPLEASHLPNELPCAKVMGAARNRAKAFRPTSVVNISGMSFGALSAPAVEAMNQGARIAGVLHNTGEGGLGAPHQAGGDLIFQIGTGYFGCRDSSGNFNLERLVELVGTNPVKAIEIKISQGAKPGHGGILPAAKVTKEIAEARGVAPGVDCVSPSSHRAFHDVSSMLDFVELIAEATGLPVGIKSAVGEMGFFDDLAAQMVSSGRGIDFITIDGGEGGTGAAPLAFADHVSLPFRAGFSAVYKTFYEAGLANDIVFNGSGKNGIPANAFLAFALGADMVSVGREAMLSIGCIQAQRCHTGRCPAGIATQSKWLMRGLDPSFKSARVANYLVALREELVSLSSVCREVHPALVGLDSIDLLNAETVVSASDSFGYEPPMGRVSAEARAYLEQFALGARSA